MQSCANDAFVQPADFIVFVELVQKFDRLSQRILGCGWVSSAPAIEVDTILRLAPAQLDVVIDCGAISVTGPRPYWRDAAQSNWS